MNQADSNSQHAKARSRLGRLAWLMDSSIRLPGGFRIGLDPIIGLVPGLGDLLSAGPAFYIIAMAARLRVPPSVLIRMGGNVLLELVIGVIPLFGDVFDAAYKANLRNVRLMEAHLDDPARTRHQSRWWIAVTLILILALLTAVLAAVLGLIGWLWTLMA